MALSSASAANDDMASDNALAIDSADNASAISYADSDSSLSVASSDSREAISYDSITDDGSLGSGPLGDGATTIYVSKTGDDSKDGLSEENAVATIAKAYELAGDGSTINIGAGTYDQSSSITIAKSVTFNGAEGAIINRVGNAAVFSHTASNALAIRGIEFTSNTTSSNPIINMGGSGSLTVENCKFHDMNLPASGTNGIIKIFYQSNAVIDNCEFHNLGGGTKNNQMFLSILGSGTTTIKNSFFHDIAPDTIIRAVIYPASADATLNVENTVFSRINGDMYAIIDKSNGIMHVTNCTFSDNELTGDNVKGVVASVGSNSKETLVSACTFTNNAANYSIYDKDAPFTVENCAFDIKEGKYAIASATNGLVIANYNFYGTNDNPSAFLDNVTTSNWVIMSASASADSVATGDSITITADFSKYTDGTTTGDVTGTMAEVPVQFANDDAKGAISEITYEDNKAVVTYTGIAEGDDTVTVTVASVSTTIPITITAPAPTGTTIYVKADGDDENNGLSPETAVATITKAIEIISDSEGIDYTILVANGNYISGTIQSPEGKNINLIGEDRESTIIHIPDQTYGINVYQDNVEWRIENLTICDMNSTATRSGAIVYSGDGGSIYVNNCIIKNIHTKTGAFNIQTNGGIATMNNTIIEDIYATVASSSVMYFNGEGIINIDNVEIHGFALDDAYVSSTSYARAVFYEYGKNDVINLMNSRITDNALPLYSGIIESKSKFNVINTTFANNYINTSQSGASGGQYMFWTGTSSNSASAFTFSQCTIVNNTIAKNDRSIFYLQYGTHNVEYSIIMDNKFANGNDATFSSGSGSSMTADYNYWGSNSKPNADVSNWAIITADVPEYAFVGVADDIKVYLNTYNTTSGTTGNLEKTMPEITLGASYALCTSNPSTVTIKDGEGTITYTASEAGDETLTLSSGDAFSFEVNADISTLIYVDGSVETSGTGTSENPFKTITEALNVAADGKVILIRSGTYTESDLAINDDIVVKADKNAVVVIDADSEGRIFIITSTATLKDLTLTGGMTNDAGGAIFVNGGNLTLNNINITSCGAGSGGAIGTTAGSNLTVSNSAFSENIALYGGAIYVAGEADISNCAFNNHEMSTYGGAIYVNSTSPVTISSNTFNGNNADKGEAIYIENGAVALSENTIADEETIYLAGGSINSVLIFLSNSTITGEPGQEITLAATLTDDQGNAIKGGSVVFTADGETIATIDLSGSNALQTTYTVPNDADADIVISGSYTLGSEGIVASGVVHPAIPNWFIEGGSGYETLAEAIAAADNGDVIYGRPGTYTVNGITVSKDITIKANETGAIVLDGGKSRIFTIGTLTTLTLLNLDLTNGGTSGGGFVSVSSTGTLNIINSTLRDLKPTSAGGAISVTSGGKVNIEGSRFENISSTAGSVILSATGASSVITIKDSGFNNINASNDYTLMQIAGNVSIERSNFTNIVGKYQSNWYGAIGVTSSGNAAVTECQFINVTGGDGSAIYFSSNGNLTVTKSVFMNNKNYRGAIYVNNPASANINYNLFIGNEAGGSDAADLYKNTRTNQNVNANYNFWGTNSKPTESQITTVSDAEYWTVVELSANGDTVYLGTTPVIDVKFIATNGVENVTLDGLMPDYVVDLSASAGSIEPDSVTIANNAASATYTPQSDGTVTITAAPAGAELVLTVVNPSVLLVVSTEGNDITGAGTFDNPYATIAHAFSQVTETRNVIYLVKTDEDYEESNLTVSGNVVIKGEDKTVTIDAGMKGRIFVVSGTLAIEDLTLTGGMANEAGGAIFVNGGNLTVNNVNINGCGAGSGGAIGTTAGSNLTVSNSAFSENIAINGGAIYVAGEAEISSSEFNDHEMGTYGGAIYVNTTSPVSISSNKFNGNDADKGEAIYIENGAVTLSGNTITDEETIYLAGGSVNSVLIFLSNNTVNAEFGEEVTLTATLTDDQANPIRGGSVVFTANGETIATVDLSGNSPLQTAYSIPVDAAGDIVISGSYSLDNEGIVATGTIHPTIINWFIEGGNGYETLTEAIAAASAGDVIYGNPGTYDLSGIIIDKAVTIKANESGSIILNGNGNQIFNTKANVILNNLTFINGSATANGGLIYVASGSLSINNSVFKDSEASSGQGSAIYVASGSASIVIDNSAFDNIKAATALINCRSTSTVFTVTKTNFTNIEVSTNGLFYLYEGGISASECQFINVSGGEGAAVYFYGQSNNNITNCVFDNVTTNGNGIIYSNSKTANVSYNVFLEINKGIYSSSSYSAITANYNYWGTNDQPSDYVNANTILNNWVIMSVTPSEIEAVEIDTAQEFIVDFKQYTDGTANYTLADTIPELIVSASAINGALDQSEIATVDNQAIFTYSANVAGEDTVTFSNANIAIPVTFNVSLDPIGVIFVAKNGTATGAGTSDDPVDTIARAIELANEANGKIYIMEGTYTETGFNITKDLVITGLGNVVIDADNVTARMFNIGSDVNSFVLKNVEITKANQGFGAVLYNNYGADVVFNNVSINESYANGYGNSALIINKGNLSIVDSNISNNGPITCIIYNEGNVTVNNTSFEDNIVNTSSTTFGVIYSSGNCTVAIENSNFTNIDSIRGAIYSKATEGGNLSISNSKFENCSASFENNFGYGGAVYSEVPLTVSNSTFINSKSYKDGAAIYAAKGGEITNSVFCGGVSENEDTSEIYTGGDLTLSNNVFSAPTSDRYVVKAASGASVTATDNWFGTNNASSVVNGFAPESWVIMTVDPVSVEDVKIGDPVEICIDFKHTNNTQGIIGEFTGTLAEITIYASANNGTFAVNPVTTSDLEAKIIYTPEYGGENIVLINSESKDKVPVTIMVIEPYFGPIYVAESGSASGKGTEDDPVNTIAKAMELAKEGSGQIIIKEGTYNENNIFIDGDKTISISGDGDVVIAGTGVSNETIFNISAKEVSIKGITFTNNVARNGAAIKVAGRSNALKEINLTIEECIFDGLNSTYEGGAIFGEYLKGKFVVNNCIFKNNFINSSRGAGIYVGYSAYDDALDLVINNTLFMDNFANNAAAHLAAEHITIENCNFTNNSAKYYPGALNIYNSTVSINNCIFKDNKGSKNAAAIYIDGIKDQPRKTTSINNTVIENNGGVDTKIPAIYVITDVLKIENSVIVNDHNIETGTTSSYGGITGQGVVVATNNWWGTNDPSALVNGTNITIDKWVIMNASLNASNILTGESVEITVDFKHTNSTDGTIAAFEGYLPKELTVNGIVSNGALNPSEVTTTGLEAKFTFIPEFIGENIATLTCDNEAIPVIVNVKVAKKETILTADEEITIEFGSGSMEVTLTAEGAPVEGKIISVIVNDEISLSGTTNAQGVATIDLSSVPIGTYNAEIKFEEDDEYIGSNAVSKITVKEPAKTSEDLQKLIDETPTGGVLNLSNIEFVNVSGINITKDITIVGDNLTINTVGDGNPVFNIASNVSNVSISGVEFLANNGDVLVKVTAANGTDDLSIVNPAIELANNTVIPANENVVPSSITLFELESERAVLAPSNEISIKDNVLPEGAKAFDFAIAGLNNGSDVNIPKGGNINTNSTTPVVKAATTITAKGMKTTTVNTKINGKKAGKNYSITLKDSNGNVLAGKEVLISFNGKIYKCTTNAKGVATVKVALSKKGTYPVVVSFLGDDKYNGSFAVAKIKVNPQKVKLTVAKKKYKASKKKKILMATLKASNKKAIKGKKIVFIVNKKKYTAKTNKKGIAKVKVKLSKKKTYKFTVKFAGDNTFKKATKKGKVKIV